MKRGISTLSGTKRYTKKRVTQKGGANTRASKIKRYFLIIAALFVTIPILSSTLDEVAPNKLKALSITFIILGIVAIVLLWGF